MNFIEFLNPLGLFSFLLILGCLGRRSFISYGNVRDFLFEKRQWSWRIFVAQYRSIFLVLALILLSISMGRPVIPQQPQVVSKSGVDIVFALDVSGSMSSQDILPSRLDVAKKYLRKFVSQLVSDRVGLVIFAGKPFTQSPMTFDYGVMDQYLEGVSVQSIDQMVFGLRGTAMGDALLAGLQRFDLEDGGREKVIILLTDGETTHGVDPLEVVKKAAFYGVKIYTIGIGSKDPKPLMQQGRNGKVVPVLGGDGKPVMSAVDEKTLRAIAEQTMGQYFLAKDEQTIKSVMDEILSLEKKPLESETLQPYYELYPYFIWAGLILLVFYLWSRAVIRVFE